MRGLIFICLLFPPAAAGAETRDPLLERYKGLRAAIEESLPEALNAETDVKRLCLRYGDVKDWAGLRADRVKIVDRLKEMQNALSKQRDELAKVRRLLYMKNGAAEIQSFRNGENVAFDRLFESVIFGRRFHDHLTSTLAGLRRTLHREQELYISAQIAYERSQQFKILAAISLTLIGFIGFGGVIVIRRNNARQLARIQHAQKSARSRIQRRLFSRGDGRRTL